MMWRNYLSDLGNQLTVLWKVPCRVVFEMLCDNCPKDLANLVKSKVLEPAHQTFAAEYLGESGLPEACEILMNLALDQNEVAVTREGAWLGLRQIEGADLTGVAESFVLSTSQALQRIGQEMKKEIDDERRIG